MVDNLIHGDLTNHSHMNVTGCLGKPTSRKSAWPIQLGNQHKKKGFTNEKNHDFTSQNRAVFQCLT